MKYKFKNNEGQTLIEILFAIALVTVVMVAVVSRTIEAVRNANFAKNQSLATRFAQEGVEWARIQRDGLRWEGFEAEIAPGPRIFCVYDLSLNLAGLTEATCGIDSDADNIPGTIFDRQLEFVFVEDLGVSGNYISVTVTVNWKDNIGVHSSKLNTRLTEWTFEI